MTKEEKILESKYKDLWLRAVKDLGKENITKFTLHAPEIFIEVFTKDGKITKYNL